METSYIIHIYIFGQIIKTATFSNRKEARAFYSSNIGHEGQYTELLVDGTALTTAQAKRYFNLGKSKAKSHDNFKITRVYKEEPA